MLILRIWKNQPGKYFFISTKDARGNWKDHSFARDEFGEIPEFIEDNKDKDLYFCPHGFSKRKRRKEFAVLPRLLYSDMDEIDPRAIKYKPTIAIESSPSRYVGLWLTDKPITEELNRRLARAIGENNGGWDLTQVLRIPNTLNFKYNSTPRVKVVWIDGPTYTISDLDKRLPGVLRESSNIGDSDAASVYKKWERKIPFSIRRELMAKKVTMGKRSEMLWKMESSLLEAGIPVEDCFLLIKSSQWNKFAGRRNEDEQLRRELDKVVNSHFSASRPVAGEDEGDERRLIVRSMDTIEEEDLDWVWFPYLAKGELTILEGDPGTCKSWLMEMVGVAICDGLTLPSVKPKKMTPGRVLYFDNENSAGTVVKPRIRAAGLKNLGGFFICEAAFSIGDEDLMDEVYEILDRVRPSLVVFDTLNSFLGGADAYKGHEAQQMMMHFKEIGKRYDCAVAVIRHLTKGGKGVSAMHRGQGNISLTGYARIVITCGHVPDEVKEVRAMIPVKCNVAAIPQAMKYEVVPQGASAKFNWLGFIDLTADQILKAIPVADTTDDADAKKFLEEVLDDGEALDEARLRRMSGARSIEWKTMLRVAEELKVKKEKRKGKTFWALDL